MQAGPTVYVVDDDLAMRDSLTWLIASAGHHVETFETAHGFLNHISEFTSSPRGCLVADVRLPGMSGLELQDQLNEMGIDLPVVMITGHGDVPLAVRAIKAGALDFIEKPFSDHVLLGGIRQALQRQSQQEATALNLAQVKQRYDGLSRRERQVLHLVVQGRLNKQIAADLDLSQKTVEVHRAHTMDKMQATSLAELVRMAVALEQAGLIDSQHVQVGDT
ncbi:MAG: response regulator transcription factor [Phycisphaeraceae bacterium]